MSIDTNRARLGAALRQLRREKSLTLAEVSQRTGFSVPTLSKVENDRLSLSYDKLIRLSEGLGVDAYFAVRLDAMWDLICISRS